MRIEQNRMKEFEEKVVVHAKRLFRYVNARCKDEELSRDIVQETMIIAQEQFTRGEYQEKGLIWFWLMKIANNMLMGYFRTQNRRQEAIRANRMQICDNLGWTEKGTCVGTCEDGDILFSEENALKLRHNIEKNLPLLIQTDFQLLALSESEREILLSRHVKMQVFKEIAGNADLPLSTLMSRYYTMMRKVRLQLSGMEQAGLFDRTLDISDIRKIMRERDRSHSEKKSVQTARKKHSRRKNGPKE